MESFTIITTEADDFTRKIHTRMPVILRPEGYDHWLTAKERAADCLVPWSEGLKVERVDSIVNNARNETPQCIQTIVA